MMSLGDILDHARACRAEPERNYAFDECIMDWRRRWRQGTGNAITLSDKDLTKLRATVMRHNRRNRNGVPG